MDGDLRRHRRLVAIKAVHTVAWTFFVAAILSIPAAALRDRYDVALGAALIVMVEVVILALNRWHCPLTPIAARYTEDRRANFDIYLPEWLARLNKQIFGPLYAAAMLFAWARWSGWFG